MIFRVGQKVVCVDGSPPRHSTHQARVVYGEIYTVAGIDPENGTGVYLYETPHNDIPAGSTYPRGWRPTRFQPVVERKTDTGMAILREILDRESHQDRVPERVRE